MEFIHENRCNEFYYIKEFYNFNDLKIGLVCSVKDEKVIMRMARLYLMDDVIDVI